jgi:hypothetical protein
VLLKAPRTYSINVAAPAAVLLSGNQFAKTQRFLTALNVQCMSSESHRRQLEANSYPAVRQLYGAMQHVIFTGLKQEGKQMTWKGDAQASAPGKFAINIAY